VIIVGHSRRANYYIPENTICPDAAALAMGNGAGQTASLRSVLAPHMLPSPEVWLKPECVRQSGPLADSSRIQANELRTQAPCIRPLPQQAIRQQRRR